MGSESEYNPVNDDYNPPNKKRKVQHPKLVHVDTPVPQRRSTRIACKKFSENEEKDSSQIHSALNLNKRKSARLQQRQQNEQNNDIQHELNGNSNSTENHWKGRLRHKQTK